MDKYRDIKKISRKKYNLNKTYIQISKDLHILIKEYCGSKNLKVKDFIDDAIRGKLKNA